MSNIRSLEDKYLKAKIAYYEGEPFLSDSEFDSLEQTLKEKGSKVIEQVGSKRKDFDFSHPSKMLSLAKIQTEEDDEGVINFMEEEFMKWYNKNKAQVGDLDITASPKFDGNAINIIYQGDTLVNVLTRGDGFTGKDILKRFKPYLPEKIITSELTLKDTDVLEIRCEVVIDINLFNEKYKGTKEEGKFANARNYVAGVIGKDDFDIVKVSELKIIPLHFLLNGKHLSQISFCKNEVFHTNYDVTLKAEDYIKTFKTYIKLRKGFDYLLDGVVFSFAADVREQLGENDHDPEWAIAVKFVPIETITDYSGIEWNISKRGELIPTILLKPVLLDGTTVRRASGYNASYILKNKIGPGAEVSIAKAGDIIPEIQKVTKEADSSILFPSKCTSCQSDVTYDEVHLRCTNENCPGRIAKQLTGALTTLDIKRVGEKTIEPFASDFANMYELIQWVFTEAETIDGGIDQYGIEFGSRSHEIFVKAFKSIKSLTYEQVIRMLGYDNVGRKISTQLALEHAGLDFDYAHLEKALVTKLRSPEISDYIKEVVRGLENLGITIDKPKADEKKSDDAIGIVMTGSPKTFGYKTKSEFLQKFPHLFETKLNSPDCKFLVTDDLGSISSKMKQAEKKGIEIVLYKNF